MVKKIRVLVCDDHVLFREGVKSVLSGEPDIQLVGEAGDGAEAVAKASQLHPNVVLVDIGMPVLRGYEVVRQIRKNDPSIHSLMLTVYDDEELVARCLNAGATGYVVKDTPPAQLVYAVRCAAKGERYLSPKALKGIVGHHVKAERATTRYDLLSDRERQILVMLAEGSSLKDVASKLKLSVKTVDAHRYNIMRKLDLHDRTQLIHFAIRNKLIGDYPVGMM
jgi:two-component system, NarL family, response regulator NreC